MKNFEIEISASNVVYRRASTPTELVSALSRANGRVSVTALVTADESFAGIAGREEVFFGTADQARAWARSL
jgi:hypothetical protein